VNAAFRRVDDGVPAPSRNDEYLLYQTLIGAWPPDAACADETFVQRIQAYMTKAMREAKVFSSWTSPNEAYESAVTDFVARIVAHEPFLDDFLPFQAKVARFGLINSLAQTLLRLTAPGVPDTYQGQELCDFSLVDPDNRRPVDYGRRRDLLDELRRNANPRELLERISDGRAKLFVTWRGLTLRREQPGLFTTGTYEPLHAAGPKADHVFAFARRHDNRAAITIIPRLPATLGDGWGGTTIALPHGTWRNVFTGASIVGSENVSLLTILADFPVALLIRA
jgi:(1->4)-alpha-D-glucan 1-alpha-D-glucosylmutase